MAKQYKRKLYHECNSSDKTRRQDIRKSLNASERQRGRSIAVSEMREHNDLFNDKFIKDLRYDLEFEHADKCWRKERSAPETKFANTLARFGLPHVRPYKCRCVSPDKMSKKDILKHFGYL